MHIHKYSKWSEVIETHNSGHKQQWRVCTTCNKADFRTLWWDSQTNIREIIRVIRDLLITPSNKGGDDLLAQLKKI